jgi:hypothetical protein
MNLLNKAMKSFEKEFIREETPLDPVKDTVYYGRMSDKEVEEMQVRNNLATQEKIAELGKKWILHPDNKVTRITRKEK